jgi:hypothetical protein
LSEENIRGFSVLPKNLWAERWKGWRENWKALLKSLIRLLLLTPVYNWLSQLSGETLVILGELATLHDKIAMEVARNANNPIGLVTRGLRHHLGERDLQRTAGSCDLDPFLLAVSTVFDPLSGYS